LIAVSKLVQPHYRVNWIFPIAFRSKEQKQNTAGRNRRKTFFKKLSNKNGLSKPARTSRQNGQQMIP